MWDTFTLENRFKQILSSAIAKMFAPSSTAGASTFTLDIFSNIAFQPVSVVKIRFVNRFVVFLCMLFVALWFATITGLISTLVFLVLYFTKLKSKQLLNYLPNVWTSLGILGTFIAIVYSLEDLQNSSSGNEINVIGLIEDIAPAFITSIIGICGAIITSIAIKIIYAIEEKKEERIYADIVGGNISPELMLNRINRSIEKLINVTTL